MTLLRKLNSTLGKSTGFTIKRVPSPAPAAPAAQKAAAPKKAATPEPVAFKPPADPGIDRLLTAPVFVMSPVRSGSTLLRVLLDGHSQLHAPHELHIRRLTVGQSTRLAGRSMEALGLDRGDLEHLLWDRVMHRELTKSGKSFIVEKTPSNAFAWRRIAACWPDARFVFLLRHPMSIAQSWYEAHPDKRNPEEAAVDALRYMKAVESARRGLSGVTVRYEDLTADPETELRRVCTFLEIDWEPVMLEYGKRPEESFQKGLGDWTDKIRSGAVQPGRPLPDPARIPEVLKGVCAEWGYLEESAKTS